MENLSEKITATQMITRALLKVIAAIVVLGGTVWLYLDEFGVKEAPDNLEEVVKKADSTLNADTLKFK